MQKNKWCTPPDGCHMLIFQSEPSRLVMMHKIIMMIPSTLLYCRNRDNQPFPPRKLKTRSSHQLRNSSEDSAAGPVVSTLGGAAPTKTPTKTSPPALASRSPAGPPSWRRRLRPAPAKPRWLAFSRFAHCREGSVAQYRAAAKT
jgi:hypothetical protein